MQLLAVYAALLAILFVILSVRTLRLRRRLQIAVGDAGDQTLLRAVRAHANFAEYVPLCLIMIFLCAQQGASAWVIHALCASLLLGRAAHAYGVSQIDEDFRFRVAGMSLTFSVLVIAACILLVSALREMAGAT